MIKSSSILILIIFHHTYAYPGDGDNRHEPLMRLSEIRGSIVKNFNFENRSLPHRKSIIEGYFCPAETDEDISYLEEASKHDYRLKYCLFTKKFQENEERICKREVKPVLLEIHDDKKNALTCGPALQQILHTLTYFDCGDADALERFQEESVRKNQKTYKFKRQFRFRHQICYDSVGKSVLWTMHRILTPELFQNPHIQKQQLPETKISTNSYFMDTDLFLILKRRYKQEKNKDASKPGTFIMIPRPLIPAEHYALPMLKKALNHYINMAPLWEKLVPLMTAIDQGIKQAQMNLQSKNPESYMESELLIHTTVTPKTNDKTSSTWLNLLLFDGNIWYKFIFQKIVNSGVLIIIHNTPGNPPDPSTACLVGKQKQCNFQEWSKDEEIRRNIISDGISKYACCCEIEADDTKRIFSHYYKIDKYLKIHSLITEG